jgi:AcrR family transcriptional regulator
MARASKSAKPRLSAPERRIQLMEAGRKVFASIGFEGAAIEEIARQAGVTKPIVYEHFGSKEGIHAAVVDREMDRLVALVSLSIGAGSPRARFEGAVLAFLTYVEQEPEGFAVLTRDSSTAHARRGLTRVIDDLADRIGDVFSVEFKRAGYNAKVGPIYANALIGMVTQVGQWWASDHHGFSVEQVARHVAALGWMGLRHLPKTPEPLQQEPKKKATKA